MKRIRKERSLKIILLAVTTIFLLQNVTYSTDLFYQDKLRATVGVDPNRTKKVLQLYQDEKIKKMGNSMEGRLKKREKAALKHLSKLGANLDLVALQLERVPRIELELSHIEPSKLADEARYRRESEKRMIKKVQRLAGLLESPIGIHVMPLGDVHGITERWFSGTVYEITPSILHKQNIANDPEKEKYFLENFVETFFSTIAFGFRTKKGKPSVPIALFIKDWEPERGLYEPVNVFLRREVVMLNYGNKRLFEDQLLGLVQWDFEEIDGMAWADLRIKIAEKYIDKLLEIAEKMALSKSLGVHKRLPSPEIQDSL